MPDNKLVQDEDQRTANYEAIKENDRTEVIGLNRETVANEIDTKNEIVGGRFIARISQIVDYAFFLLYGLLVIRLLLALFAANNSNAFVQFIKNITDPFYAPFKGIVPTLTAEGGFTLVLPIVIAIFVYIFLYLAINGLLRIFVSRKKTV